jgi:hypothetical protein
MSELGVRCEPQTLLFHCRLWQARNVLEWHLVQLSFLSAEQADLHMLAGILALERGQPDEARRRFGKALALCPTGVTAEGDFAGRSMAETLLKRLPKK